MAAMDPQEASRRAQEMEGWSVQDGALRRQYSCGDFAGSMAFVNRVADAANEADHHPDIAISWDTVTLSWVSHSEGGITERDFQMARRSDELAGAG
jgi:4a-hydroxytetrahydrobiopterin dehydratase